MATACGIGLKGQHKSAQGRAKIDKVDRSAALGTRSQTIFFKALKVRNNMRDATELRRIVRPRDAHRGRLSDRTLIINALTWGSVDIASLRLLTPGYGENSPSGNFVA